MKKIISLLLLSSTACFAGTTHVTCKATSLKNDQLNFESFDLAVNAKSVQIAKLFLTSSYVANENEQIKSDEGSSDPSAAKDAQQTQAFLAAAEQGLALNGTVIPYVTGPKTPRVRYEMSFLTKTLDNATIIDSLAPEANSMKLFIPLENGKPSYDEIYFEYDGTQGPYFDHFTCN